MKTFLPPNKFYSAADIPSAADEAGASAPAPTPDAPAEISNPDRGYMGHRRTPALGTSVSSAAIDCQEPVAADHYHDEVLYLLLKFHDKPETPDFPEIPDEHSFLSEIESPFLHFLLSKKSAPRSDPVWADASPLFLRDA